MKANEIVSVLNHFKDSSYQRIFFDGAWGIGKTKYVKDFKNAHSNSCYVSLFGKKDIDSIIQEIYFHIINSVPKGILKKYFRKFREIFDNVNIEFHGITISVPLIERLYSSLYKELVKKGTYIIIFDDLERKHHDLDIKEILGLVDSLANIDNIKTVLIAAADQLEEDEATFKNYKEKAIDRTYTIDGYADEAPSNILGKEVWKVIGKLAENFEFSNLRTFEKTNLFLKEVIAVVGEDIFTDKFTKNDVYRMCFASVLFRIEHKGEMILLENNGERNDFLNAYYTSGESGVIEYLNNFILKNSLDNVLSKNVFHHIKSWYETGSYSSEKIFNLIDSINSYEEKPKSFYSSESDLIEIIEQSREYIRNLEGTEQIEDIISRLATALFWCEVLTVEFGINEGEILSLVSNNISKKIDIDKTIYENQIDSNVESEEARDIINSINEALKVDYFYQILKRIKDCFNERSYSDYHYIRKLTDSIVSTMDLPIKNNLSKSISENKYYFPIPSGRITEDQWNWCHLIIKLVATINKYWEIENYYDDFTAYLCSIENTQQDKMLQYRLTQLLGKDIIVVSK